MKIAEIIMLKNSELEDKIRILEKELQQLRSDREKLLLRISKESEIIDAEIRRAQILQSASISELTRPDAGVSVMKSISPHLHDDYRQIARSFFFDPVWYLQRYHDVADAGVDPCLHYLLHGGHEGRAAGPVFDGGRYLTANPDVKSAAYNPLLHFLRHGLSEQRRISPPSNYEVASDTAGRWQTRTSVVWFFVGDILDWIANHAHLTGIGHVTAELLHEILTSGDRKIALCIRGESHSGLICLHDEVQLRALSKIASCEIKSDSIDVTSQPEVGDHVVFTGAVWGPPYRALFEHLANINITTSVLVHDIIPILSPELVGSRHEQIFGQWLDVVLKFSSTILVSNRLIAEHIARWSVCNRFHYGAKIKQVSFGSRKRKIPTEWSSKFNNIRREHFVLCVGTIDRRKNQTFLCEIWEKLTAEFGSKAIPQLVLVGRDDLKIRSNFDIERLVDEKQIVIIENLSDEHVAKLYDECLFTAFPSTNEGYGLPVAESLTAGKLCLVSDLKIFRETFGSMVWYFNHRSLIESAEIFRLALNEEIRQATLSHNEKEYSPGSWSSTVQEILTDALETVSSTEDEIAVKSMTSSYAEDELSDSLLSIKLADRWCVSQSPEVSIIIVNLNSSQATLDCLQRIWACTEGIFYEIIIVDNGSVSKELRRLQYLGDGVRIIEIGVNRFRGEASNIAVEAAQGCYVCFLDSNTFVQKGWLAALTYPMRDDSTIGATGPLLLSPDGHFQQGSGSLDANACFQPLKEESKHVLIHSKKLQLVDYISATALLVRRELFISVGGYDFNYEPFGFEDFDLCLKIQVFGYQVLFCPLARVVCRKLNVDVDDGQSSSDLYLVEINRAKFVSRWGRYLQDRIQSSLKGDYRRIFRPMVEASVETYEERNENASSKRAVIYTPYALTVGGGEKYILSLASILSKIGTVTLVTPNPYSKLRVNLLGVEFDLRLNEVSMASRSDLEVMREPEILVVMGNSIVPPCPPNGQKNIYICQFPFPKDNLTLEDRRSIESFSHIMVYSNYAAMHVKHGLEKLGVYEKKIDVLPPPVKQYESSAKKTNHIVSVGRFFVGGHCKRHDRLIEAFKIVAKRTIEPVELHIVGSLTPKPVHMAYLADLMASVEGYRIHFHVNAPVEKLAELYGSSQIYWHGTGLDADLANEPWAAEHFGITIVEAMSARAIPFAFRSGGAPDIIQHGYNGFLYGSLEELVEQTVDVLESSSTRKGELGNAASDRAGNYTIENFARRFNSFLDSQCLQV